MPDCVTGWSAGQDPNGLVDAQAQARGGRFEVVKSLGAIDPQEREVDTLALR